MLTLFRNRLYMAVVTGHASVDILNSVGPVLLAVLAGPLALSNAQIGLALTLYTFIGALSQPIFGWLADGFRGRMALLAGLGVLWMAICYAVIAFAPGWSILLTFLLLAALGSGVFHPTATASAASAHPDRPASATSTFFFCGQAGLALGPILGGVLFRYGANLGVLPLALLALLPAVLLLTAPAAQPLARHGRAGATATRVTLMAIVAFVALVALRSSIQAVYASFLPKLFADRGWDPAAFGAMSGAFMIAAAFGNLISGIVADRYGMRLATVAPLLGGVPAGLICLWAPTVPAAFVASALTGLLVGGQHSVLVVHAQRLIPVRQGFAAGLILGFTFATGGIGTWLTGVAADRIGLDSAMQIVTLLGLPSAALALTLPGRERVSHVAPRPDEERMTQPAR